MSYILDSLKKLEQEKRTLQFDIKSALLKEEGPKKNVAGLKSTIRALTGLSVLFCALAGIFYHRAVQEGPASPAVISPREKAAKMPAGSHAGDQGLALSGEKSHSGRVPGKGRLPEGNGGEKDKTGTRAGSPSTPVLPQDPPVREAGTPAKPPEFTIKGVIFFGKGNPENYIILRDNKNARIRLKESDRYKNMELTDILPHKALFLRNGDILEKGMGD